MTICPAGGSARTSAIRSVIAICAAALCTVMLDAPMLRAQVAGTLTVSGAPLSFGNPTAADLTAGLLEAASPVSFQVDVDSAGVPVTTTVSIRAVGGDIGGMKSVADLQWRRGDLGTWQSLTESDAIIETRSYSGNQAETWGNTIHFRVVLRWVGDSPSAYQATFVVSLSRTET